MPQRLNLHNQASISLRNLLGQRTMPSSRNSGHDLAGRCCSTRSQEHLRDRARPQIVSGSTCRLLKYLESIIALVSPPTLRIQLHSFDPSSHQPLPVDSAHVLVHNIFFHRSGQILLKFGKPLLKKLVRRLNPRTSGIWKSF